jgi:hypothetical protein
MRLQGGLVNQILKPIVLSSAFAVCVMLFGCSNLARPGDAPAESEAATAVTGHSGNVCDQFCQSQGGPFYLLSFASSETQCSQKGGDWYTADQGYPGPPPGCCCKCTRIDFCL